MSRLKNIFGPKSRSGSDGTALASTATDEAPALSSAPQPFSESQTLREVPLGVIGQRSEMLRQGIDGLAARLEDLVTLKDDFRSILEPLADISQELSEARMRMAELERTLDDERQAGAAARASLADATHRFGKIETAHGEAQARLTQFQSELTENNALVERQRIELRDKTILIENYERQIFDHAEQNRLLAGENKALRAEAQAADAAIARIEQELQATRETLNANQQDCLRLQALSEEQAGELSEARAQLEEALTAADLGRQTLAELEGQLEVESSRREHAESQLSAESAAYRANRASLEMKIESASHRANSAEQMLIQARNQLKEKDEAHRAALRQAKEAVLAREALERSIQNLQNDLARQSERFTEMQKARTELESRCDMLGKAIAAKDVMIDQQAERNSLLGERIADLTHRHQVERNELEAANRRLMEDLESERSERSLVQGALEIARESRTALQKQHEALKRGWRTGRMPEADESQDETAGAKIHPFVPNLK